MLNTMLNRYGRHYGTEGQRTTMLDSARRMMTKQTGVVTTPPEVPAAPGLSSRISPGTVPMKKEMR